MGFPDYQPFILATCELTGERSETIPECENKTKVGYEPPPTEAENDDVIGTSACTLISVCGVVVVVVVVLDIPSMYYSLRTKWNNLEFLRRLLRTLVTRIRQL